MSWCSRCTDCIESAGDQTLGCLDDLIAKDVWALEPPERHADDRRAQELGRLGSTAGLEGKMVGEHALEDLAGVGAHLAVMFLELGDPGGVAEQQPPRERVAVHIGEPSVKAGMAG